VVSIATGGGGSVSFYGAVSLYDVTLGVDTTSIDIQSISQDYDHLQLIISARTDENVASSDLLMTFNNDTTNANYYGLHHYWSYNTQALYEDQGRWLGRVAGDTAPANTFSMMRVMIERYAYGINKISRSEYAHRSAANAIIAGTIAMEWKSTSAINRITLSIYTGGAKLKVGTRVQLLGYKGLP
jgi:hypothetical protein